MVIPVVFYMSSGASESVVMIMMLFDLYNGGRGDEMKVMNNIMLWTKNVRSVLNGSDAERSIDQPAVHYG